MGKKGKVLSQAEIWDDSALVDSWNEAYEEYQYYHSIHARGEKVKDVLEAYERGDKGSKLISNSAAVDGMTTTGAAAPSEDGELDDGEIAEPGTTSSAAQEKPSNDQNSVPNHQAVHSTTAAMPEQLLASGPQDPALKNLMMSWYWAGYYSGFYEGQQQAHASHIESNASSDKK